MARTKSKKTARKRWDIEYILNEMRERERIEDILKEMRECSASCTSKGCRDMESFADRIDKAVAYDRCIRAGNVERCFAGYGFIES